MKTCKPFAVCFALLIFGASNFPSSTVQGEEAKDLAKAATPATATIPQLPALTIQAKLTKVIGYVGTIAHPFPGDVLELKLRELPEKFLYLPRPSQDGKTVDKKAAWIPLGEPLVLEQFETDPPNHGGGSKIRFRSSHHQSKLVIQIKARGLTPGSKVHVLLYHEHDGAPYGMAEAVGVFE
jgi:hypothetical protein